MFTCQVFIGTNLDQAAITAALDASLATDAEAAKLWKNPVQRVGVFLISWESKVIPSKCHLPQEIRHH